MFRPRHLGLALTSFLAITAAARADVIYDITGTAPGNIYPFGFSLVLTDAQVASGSFSLSGFGNGFADSGAGPRWVGDLAGFVSLTQETRGGNSADPSYLYGQLSVNATFGANDSLSGVNLSFQGADAGGIAIGTGSRSTVVFGTDDPSTCGNGRPYCSYAAAWTVTTSDPSRPIPEPAGLAVLGVGLLGLAALSEPRRRLARSRDRA